MMGMGWVSKSQVLCHPYGTKFNLKLITTKLPSLYDCEEASKYKAPAG